MIVTILEDKKGTSEVGVERPLGKLVEFPSSCFQKGNLTCQNSKVKKKLHWGWNGNIMGNMSLDPLDSEKGFIDALRKKFPNGFKVIKTGNEAVIKPLD